MKTDVTFGIGRVVTIVSDKPIIPDAQGRIKPAIEALLTTGFRLTHDVLYKGERTATLIPKT